MPFEILDSLLKLCILGVRFSQSPRQQLVLIDLFEEEKKHSGKT